MSINELIQQAVEPLVPVCVPGTYTGKNPRYITFAVLSVPDEYGDDEPEAIRHHITLHYISPLVDTPPKGSPQVVCRELCKALHRAGFSWPTVMDSADLEVRDCILECEYVEGLVLDGSL